MDLTQGKGQDRNAKDSCLSIRKWKYSNGKQSVPREMLHPQIIKIHYLYESHALKSTLTAESATGTNW